MSLVDVNWAHAAPKLAPSAKLPGRAGTQAPPGLRALWQAAPEGEPRPEEGTHSATDAQTTRPKAPIGDGRISADTGQGRTLR